MPPPVILAVDDDAASLAALEDALARRYGRDYRVVAHPAPEPAATELARIREAGEPVALVVADQWLADRTGLDFLAEVHRLHPSAQRALLVDWGDRRASPAILEGCAFGQIENYLYKPWHPPEIHLYPGVSELLAAWTREHGPRLELVQVVGRVPSPRMHEIRELLERSGIPHGLHDAGSEAGLAVLEQARLGDARLPVVALLDGHVLVEPSNREILDALGASNLDARTCDVAVVGAGPAGLAAAVYAASEGLSTIVIEREAVGGQAGMSSLIRNYLGFPSGVSGADLARRAYEQAWLFGAKFVFAREVRALEARGADRVLRLADGTDIAARAVVIATGARYRRLGVPDLERFEGAGVFYVTPGDARFLERMHVFVAGGGNSAGQAVLHLARYARRVTLVVRGASLEAGMSDYLVQDIRRRANVDVRLDTEVAGGAGHAGLERLVLRRRSTGAAETVDAAVLFVLIGAEPHTEWLAGAVQRDRRGYVLTGPEFDRAAAGWPDGRDPLRLETSLPGVFAAGDVRLGSTKRVASAAGEGGNAVQEIHEYLATVAG